LDPLVSDITLGVPATPIPETPRLLGWSGTRRLLSDYERRCIRTFCEAQSTWDGFVTGGCVGLDHFAGITLLGLFPKKQHIVIVPANRSRVAAWWRGMEGHPTLDVREMSPGTDYKARNQAIVATSDLLVAWPEYAEFDRRSFRSGTWQTVRLARQAFDNGRHLSMPEVNILSTLVV
jgi:hypothetical protein